MAWRRGEVWFDTDVLWFREQSAGPFGRLALAGADALVLPELPSFGPAQTGLDASRRNEQGGGRPSRDKTNPRRAQRNRSELTFRRRNSRR